MYHLSTTLHDIAIDLLHLAEQHLVQYREFPILAHFIYDTGELSGLRLDEPSHQKNSTLPAYILHDMQLRVMEHMEDSHAMATFVVSVGYLPSPLGTRSALVGCLDSLYQQMSLIRYFEMQNDGSVALGELVDSTVHPGSLLSSWSWLKIYNNYRQLNSLPCSQHVN